VKQFEISGKFRRKRKWQNFVKVLKGIKKEDVVEEIYSSIGSHHNVKRFEIKIEKVEEVQR